MKFIKKLNSPKKLLNLFKKRLSYECSFGAWASPLTILFDTIKKAATQALKKFPSPK
eukprot:jgi/Bigna1/147619/aug1.244_g22327